MITFKNQTIWIIGASSGIGRALAVELNARGADLILSARNVLQLEELNAELTGKHRVLPLDISDADAVLKATQDIGAFHSAIFMAAIYDPKTLDALDILKTHQMIDINLKGAFNVVHAVLPIMKRQGYGQIALCGSVAGYRGLPGGQGYSATKAGVINLAESLRAEVSALGIDVKIINPGFVKTPMTDQNDFKMPMMIEAPEAARAIADGLLSKRFEIDFPKRFTFFMKILKILPAPVYFALAGKMRPQKKA